MTLTKRIALAATASLVSVLPAAAFAAEEGEWKQTAVLYLMGAALDGDVTLGDLTAPVDLSASDVFDALEMGFMGAYRAEKGPWSFTGDITFMGLGATAKSARDLVKGDVDMDQTTLMFTVGRRVNERLEVLGTLGYIDLSTDLKTTVRLPLGGTANRKASDSASWVDPMVGVNYRVPFHEHWTFNLRGDVGGFGIGSDFTYQGLVAFRYQSGGRLGAVIGYRIIGFDYEDGDKGDASYQRYDLTEQGPLLGMTISF